MAEPLIGGQALIEGVMMKGPKKIGIAVRTSSGSIKTESFPFESIVARKKWLNIPFIRGPIGVAEMLYIGMRSLNISSKYAYEEDGEDQSVWWTVLSIVLATFIAIVVFKALPLGVAEGISMFFSLSSIGYNTIEGIAKLILFIGYIAVISLIPDIFRVWQYHGAEHKVVRCYEEQMKLEPKIVQQCSRLHPRCGTSFVIFIIFLSIFVYLWLPLDWPLWLKLTSRIALLPVIAGISYEVIRLAGKFPNSFLFKLISGPGMATQLLTTREPDKSQLEVAIKALKVSLK